ncbi:MAG TPA: TadE/TadG family type IV pilus assembly protein [Candidatus Limnocylindrales bacterium]|nr:TadE/TadG family type IV pilus assembly protein [Candidatus Limnocylindrales bacterium]
MHSIPRSLRAAPPRHHRARRRGQALVEFAIVSIVMLLLLATVADFGRLFYAQITVENEARAGALMAARHPSSYTGACPSYSATNEIGCAIVAESRGSGVTVTPAEIAVTCENFGGTTVACTAAPQGNTRSRVQVTKVFTFMMPLLGAILGSNLTMTASVTADQQSLPPDATYVPAPTTTAAPTAPPTPAPTGTSTPAPTAGPTATPAPCTAGNAPVPNLVDGAIPGSTETVAEARAEWQTTGFAPSNFNPSSGSTNKTVTSQTPAGDVGICRSVTTYGVSVTHS